MPGGTLYVVATPLGHLGDLTTRVMETLRAVPMVAAEDTRRTRALLSHLDAHPRLIGYHAHAAPAVTSAILSALKEGQDVALVTDAGTPGVSDPGGVLVETVRRAGFRVVPLPGPSAVAAALSAAGLPADRYVFLGFLPRKGADRTHWLERIGQEECTMVIFESPERVGTLLGDLVRVCGAERPGVLAREMTKLHEEFRAGSLGELATSVGPGESLKGECTLVIAGRPRTGRNDDAERIGRAADRLLAAGVSKREATAILVDFLGASRNEAYDTVNRDR